MYKKILLSLILVSSLMAAPAVQAKGTPVIGAAVAAVESAIDTVVFSIPIIGPVIQAGMDIVDNIVTGVSQFVGYTLLKIGECTGVLDGKCLDFPTNQPNSSNISIPSAPQNVAITNCEGTERNADGSCVLYINHGYKITWSAPSDLGGASSVGYRIYRGTSETSLTSLITTAEMDGGQTFFLENRIKDPTTPFYYKVVAFNSKGESVGNVFAAPTDIRYLTDEMTLTGVGFSDSTKVYLINNGNSILCAGFTAQDSRTLTGGVCDITSAPTGNWTVRIQNPDGKKSDCVDCFRVALPEPVSPAVSITKTNLSDGIFRVDSIVGDNIYTGASVRVTADGQKLDCFSLSGFDYKNNRFPGGECNKEAFQSFLKTLGFTSDSDINSLSVEILNDSASTPVKPNNVPAFTCTSSSYSPDASAICGSSSITQYSNCGVVRSAMPQLVCTSNQVCENGVCVGCTKKTIEEACSLVYEGSTYTICNKTVDDGCGGSITCSSICTNGKSCVNNTCSK